MEGKSGRFPSLERQNRMRRIWESLRSDAGQSLVEYAFIVVLVVIVLIAALTAFGGKTSITINKVTNAIP